MVKFFISVLWWYFSVELVFSFCFCRWEPLVPVRVIRGPTTSGVLPACIVYVVHKCNKNYFKMCDRLVIKKLLDSNLKNHHHKLPQVTVENFQKISYKTCFLLANLINGYLKKRLVSPTLNVFLVFHWAFFLNSIKKL